ncbi:hypothetical protein H0H93_001850 [Arthromyces matolae]|nr:hypothetical protein H0H93_001850 [Arthromyces matolae]
MSTLPYTSSQDVNPHDFSRFLRPTVNWLKSLGSGIFSDISGRASWYISDWKDAWNYRVIPATALIFFANVLPGIAFSLDLIETTNQYGVSEVLLSSFMAAFIFSVFGAQPLTIAGVTGKFESHLLKHKTHLQFLRPHHRV